MNHSKQILKLRLTRAAESRPLRDAHEGDYVLLLMSDANLTAKGMKTPPSLFMYSGNLRVRVELCGTMEASSLMRKFSFSSFFLSQPSMIDWSNTRVLRAGGWSEKPVERKQRCDWLRDGGVIFFFFPCFLSGVFVCRKPLNTSEACCEFTSLFILFCLPVLFFIMTSSDSLLSCKFPMTCTV